MTIINMSGGKPAKPIVVEAMEETPSTLPYTFLPREGVDYLSSVTVGKDPNLVPENVKKDVSIFGVVGDLDSTGSFEPITQQGFIIWNYGLVRGTTFMKGSEWREQTYDAVTKQLIIPGIENYSLGSIRRNILPQACLVNGAKPYTLLNYRVSDSQGSIVEDAPVHSDAIELNGTPLEHTTYFATSGGSSNNIATDMFMFAQGAVTWPITFDVQFIPAVIASDTTFVVMGYTIGKYSDINPIVDGVITCDGTNVTATASLPAITIYDSLTGLYNYNVGVGWIVTNITPR